MLYTLKKAREALAESTNAYGQSDLNALINRAIQSLAGMRGWERLRKVLRFPCVGPRFSLPQGCAGLVRACVNGRPATVRAQDFTFIHSGPGDAAHPPPGFSRVLPSNILDAGQEPVMFSPLRPFALGAWSESGTEGGTALHLRCIAPDGRMLRVDLPVNRDPVYATPGAAEPETGVAFGDDSAWSSAVVHNVAEVVVEPPDGFSEYIYLYARDAETGAVLPVASYNPEVDVPVFRHYEMSGVRSGQPVEVLAEVRLEPLPLVADTDVLPFQSVNPVEWVIRGDWYMKSNEVDTAQKYYTMAAQWLQSQEVVDTTIQTSVVVNSSFVNSPGEVSMEAVNI